MTTSDGRIIAVWCTPHGGWCGPAAESANWTETGSDQVKFANNDSVKFTDDYQTGMNVVTIGGAVSPKNTEAGWGIDTESKM